jgi:predicted transcriptional regulator
VVVEFCATDSYPVPSEGANTMTAKETVRALLERLPDDCSLEDVQYHLYVVQALERGEADEQAGRTVSHEQVETELRRKWLLGHGV